LQKRLQPRCFGRSLDTFVMFSNSIAAEAAPTEPDVLTIGDIDLADVVSLLARYALRFELVEDGAPIPATFWGEREAGLIGSTVHARRDTPLHSLLHEACHLIVIPPALRAGIHTNASDSQLEEDAACYLQMLLADALPGFGMERAFADMDAWGYSFRLGSAKAWFTDDADDAAAFLQALPHLSAGIAPLFRQRTLASTGAEH
jgi:hypothetical protein